MKLRSLLFVPGDRPDRMEKALASAADALIIDLEGSVATFAKPLARSATAAFLASAERQRPLLVRVNPLGSGMTDAVVRDLLFGLTWGFASRSCRDGFIGMLAIHPNQLPLIHAAFTPTMDELRSAKAIVQAFEANPGSGALRVEGNMVDAPHLKRARRILQLSSGDTK